jgi:hypothetical protein
MPDIKFTFDPAKVKITDGEILADLTYPVRPTGPGRVRRQRAARPRAGKR